MSAYLLTQEDIDILEESGRNVNGIPVGAEATAEELAILNIVPPLPTSAGNGGGSNSSELVVENVTPRPEVTDVPQNTFDATAMQKILSQFQKSQTPAQQTLSKEQKRMLAFAGLRDAGRALQGKEGTAVTSLMGTFEKLADQNRKATAAAARNTMMQQMLGGAGSMLAGLTTAEDYRKAAQQLMMQAPFMGDAGAGLVQTATMMITEANRLQALETQEKDTVTSTVQGIETIDDLFNTVQQNDSVTGFWGMVTGVLPFTKAGEARIDVDTIRSNMALDALKRLKATGATLGSVSEKELTLLEADIKRLDLNQSKEKVLSDLNLIRRRYLEIIQKAFSTTNNRQELVDALGGEDKVSKLLNPEKFYIKFEDAEVGDVIRDYDQATGKIVYYKYLGGDKGKGSSWEKVR
jgi:hypothetical protein|tara:strand:+ start:2417 stop:3640 length:1224 start_codon:yes stop_codon:yes gene_type:complete